jgi:hypothetical protein
MVFMSIRTLRAAASAGLAFSCSLIWAVVWPASAQQANVAAPDPYTNLSQYLLVGGQAVPQQAISAAPGAQSSWVVQTGQNNNASASLNGGGNITTQIQNGSNNASTIVLNGAQNSIATSQIGNANASSIGVAGNGNSISNLQVGSGLSYQIQVIGTATPVSVQQYGRK